MLRLNPHWVRSLAVGLVLTVAPGCVAAEQNTQRGSLSRWPAAENSPPVGEGLLKQAEARAQKILDGLTLDQKIGQMTQGEIQAVTPSDVAQYCIGSVLNGGGSWPNSEKHAPDTRPT